MTAKKDAGLRHRLFHGRGRLLFRREDLHQCTAALNHPALVEGVKRLLAFGTTLDQPRVAQDGEVMRDRWLAHARLLRQLGDRAPRAAAQPHDVLTGGVGDGFGELDGIGPGHIDDFLCVII